MNHSAMIQFTDDRSRASVAKIKVLLNDLRSRGYSNETILQAVGLIKQPVRMILCPTGLSCPDDGSVRVRLGPVERALYTFFVSHPEGIDAKELWSHYDELLSIYRSQSVEDPSRIEDAIDALCEDSRASFHTNVSRIKRKIVDAIGREAGRDYVIYRHEDGLYRIDNNLKP